MPNSWMEDDAFRQRNQTSSWIFGGKGRVVKTGRVLSAASAADTVASYWNVVLLGEGEKEIDYVEIGVFPNNAKPVRPVISEVVAAKDATYAAGDIVNVSVECSSGRRQGDIVAGAGDEDYTYIFPGNHWVVSTSGTGACYAAVTAWGTYFG